MYRIYSLLDLGILYILLSFPKIVFLIWIFLYMLWFPPLVNRTWEIAPDTLFNNDLFATGDATGAATGDATGDATGAATGAVTVSITVGVCCFCSFKYLFIKLIRLIVMGFLCNLSNSSGFNKEIALVGYFSIISTLRVSSLILSNNFSISWTGNSFFCPNNSLTFFRFSVSDLIRSSYILLATLGDTSFGFKKYIC